MMTTANDLIVVFLALEILSIPLYVLARLPPAPAELAGSRHQVLRARRVLVGDLPVRHRARLRRHRHHVAHRHRRRSSAPTPCSRPGTLLAGHRAAARRARLQGRGGAVPHVDARRVPGRAHAGHRVHGVGHQGRRVRRAAADLRRRVPRSTATTGSRSVWVLAALTLAVGSIGAAAADRPQAAARVLVDRARRVPAHGARDRHRPRAGRPRSSTSSSTRSW